MSACQRCKSVRVAFVIASANGVRYSRVQNTEVEVIPHGLGITDSPNSIRMGFCLSCGQIQGEWPARRTVLEPPSLPTKVDEAKGNAEAKPARSNPESVANAAEFMKSVAEHNEKLTELIKKYRKLP